MTTYTMYINHKGEAYCQYCLEGSVEADGQYTKRQREATECVNCNGTHTPTDDNYYNVSTEAPTMNNANIYSTVTTFDKVTDECTVENMGGFSRATNRLHSVGVHDVQSVTRKTKTLKGGTKVTTITLHTPDGNIDITAFINTDEV